MFAFLLQVYGLKVWPFVARGDLNEIASMKMSERVKIILSMGHPLVFFLMLFVAPISNFSILAENWSDWDLVANNLAGMFFLHFNKDYFSFIIS